MLSTSPGVIVNRLGRILSSREYYTPVLWGAAAFLVGILPHVFFESTWDSLGYVQAYQAIIDGSFRIPLPDGSWHILAVHFWPLGFLIVPLFAVFPGYAVLVACQSAWLAAAIPALDRLLALRKIEGTGRRILLAGWMFNPILWGIHLESREGFQFLTLCIPLLLWGQWAWESRRDKSFLGMGLALLMVREDVALTVIAWCLFLLIKDRRRKVVMVLALVAMIWFPVSLFVVIKQFNGGAYIVGSWGYEWAGSTPAQVAWHVLTHPLSSLLHMATGSRIAAVAIWIGGTLAGPVFSPMWILPAIPQLGINFLSDFPNFHLPLFRYSAPILPFFWLAVVDVCWRHPRWLKAVRFLPWCLPLLLLALASRWVRDVHPDTIAVLSCLESEMPSGMDLTVTNYKGISRLWRQDRTVSTMDKGTARDRAIPLKPWILIDHVRGTLNLFPLDEIAPLEARLRGTPTHELKWEKAGLSLWGPMGKTPPCP